MNKNVDMDFVPTVSPQVVSAAVHSKAVVPLLLIHCLWWFCGWFLFYYVVPQYLVSFLGLQSSWRERDGWLLYFNCVSDVMWLLVFCGMALPHGAMGWSAVCYCGYFLSYTHWLSCFAIMSLKNRDAGCFTLVVFLYGPHLCCISFLYLDLYVLGDDAMIS